MNVLTISFFPVYLSGKCFWCWLEVFHSIAQNCRWWRQHEYLFSYKRERNGVRSKKADKRNIYHFLKNTNGNVARWHYLRCGHWFSFGEYFPNVSRKLSGGPFSLPNHLLCMSEFISLSKSDCVYSRFYTCIERLISKWLSWSLTRDSCSPKKYRKKVRLYKKSRAKVCKKERKK